MPKINVFAEVRTRSIRMNLATQEVFCGPPNTEGVRSCYVALELEEEDLKFEGEVLVTRVRTALETLAKLSGNTLQLLLPDPQNSTVAISVPLEEVIVMGNLSVK